MIGLGILTHAARRTECQALCISVALRLPEVRRRICYNPPGDSIAKGKNKLFASLLADGCEWIFIAEDDVKVLHPMAVSGYIDACRASGLGHLGFHHHRKWNPPGSGQREGVLTVWPNLVAGWSIYSREALEAVGLMDEGFYNALEHVEHTVRLALAGYAHPPRPGGLMADATGSEAWLAEQDCESTVDPACFGAAREYWRSAHADTYGVIWQ